VKNSPSSIFEMHIFFSYFARECCINFLLALLLVLLFSSINEKATAYLVKLWLKLSLIILLSCMTNLVLLSVTMIQFLHVIFGPNFLICLRVKLRFISAFHPQTAGQSEMSNRIIAGLLKMLSWRSSIKSWLRWLRRILLQYFISDRFEVHAI
jgi:hypothetical protein